MDGAFLVMLAMGGFFLQSTLPVNVTFGHQVAPVSAATVSSLMMGFAWGTGGLAVPLVGMLADRVDIAPALIIMGLAPLAAAACAMPLPGGRCRVGRTLSPRVCARSLHEGGDRGEQSTLAQQRPSRGMEVARVLSAAVWYNRRILAART